MTFTKEPWTVHNQCREVQICMGRELLVRNWEHHKKLLPSIEEAMLVIAKAAKQKMKPPKGKVAFELFGVDYMFDKNFRPWVLEANLAPRQMDMDKPMLRGLLDIVFPRYADKYGGTWSDASLDVDSSWKRLL